MISSAKLIEHNIDIVALQEPAISNLAVTIASKDWRVIYPSTHTKSPSKTRSVMLIHTDILTNNWSQTDLESGDVTVITITGEWGALTVLNIYNDCEHDHTVDLIRELQKTTDEGTHETCQESTHTVWVGDFNRHHPHWDSISDNRLFMSTMIKKAEKLISTVADAGLDLALPPKIPTHKHNVLKKWTRLDHIFLSEHSFASAKHQMF